METVITRGNLSIVVEASSDKNNFLLMGENDRYALICMLNAAPKVAAKTKVHYDRIRKHVSNAASAEEVLKAIQLVLRPEPISKETNTALIGGVSKEAADFIKNVLQK